ncbi:MAG: hypothetical protein OEO82_12890, partial [Gammaproteobacteria bacterium]|nr:hypothetical protein [Gammaproteobacteria bacterium]
MKHSQVSARNSRCIKPLLVLAVVAFVAAGCKSSVITPPGGVSMPVPSGGGMPSPPSGGQSGG